MRTITASFGRFSVLGIGKGILLLAFGIELGLISFWRNNEVTGIEGGLVLLGVSLLISLLPFWLAINRNNKPTPLERPVQLWHWSQVVSVLILLIGLASLIPELIAIFAKTPISAKYSDIVPQIEVMVRRFFWENTFVYQPITEFGHRIQPPYMPMQWGPFVISSGLGFDARWLAFGAYVASALVFFGMIQRTFLQPFERIVLAALPVAFLTALIVYEKPIFAHTVELLICSYYLLLGMSMLRGNIWMQGIALSLCLLSKFVIVFWAPVFVLSVFFAQNKQKGLLLGGIGISAILILYVIPFLSQDWHIFEKGLAYHNTVCEKVWTNEKWHAPSGRPELLEWGLGIGKYFFDYWPGEVAKRLQGMQLMAIIASVTSSLLFAGAYWKYRQQINLRLYLLLSLKAYLAFFYSMYALPYPYYYLVYISISMLILYAVFSMRNGGEFIDRSKHGLSHDNELSS